MLSQVSPSHHIFRFHFTSKVSKVLEKWAGIVLKEVRSHSLEAGTDASLWHQPKYGIDKKYIDDDNDGDIDYDVDNEKEE